LAENWLVDTNVCIAALNKRSAPVRGHFSDAMARGDFLAISAISVFELHYGAAGSSREVDNTAQLAILSLA
jgi:predicted nucleic acid-binding protein